MPENGYEGMLGYAYNTGSDDEKLTSAGVTVGLGDQLLYGLKVSNVKPMIILHLNYFHEAKKNAVSIIPFAKGKL